jgi:hypothetical protein
MGASRSGTAESSGFAQAIWRSLLRKIRCSSITYGLGGSSCALSSIAG